MSHVPPPLKKEVKQGLHTSENLGSHPGILPTSHRLTFVRFSGKRSGDRSGGRWVGRPASSGSSVGQEEEGAGAGAAPFLRGKWNDADIPGGRRPGYGGICTSTEASGGGGALRPHEDIPLGCGHSPACDPGPWWGWGLLLRREPSTPWPGLIPMTQLLSDSAPHSK